ncbi:ion channel [Deinococcus maricopensis]|uniref:Ion transport 2 domain protein n=1 Tax=Deinococcus maricopensis (strain DSM 21211 / LMG 22137 / NRRL B-23946 / LB-34) TaxID=709986 RepID=E8U9P0_DEIML|nr:ion channel [Deinococcus maricopensis]ADV67779.1 Ion transport 2 domain protein [Deinococcus maricopensis DSM 21211]
MTLPEPPHDLGLGRVVAEQAEERFLNKDGSFNVRREGLGWRAVSAYGDLLTVSWPVFFALLAGAYLLLNALFGAAYYALGPGALSDAPTDGYGRYLSCFFFSVQTFGTIGFGHVYPKTFAADALVTIEAFVGLLGVALATGVLFSRFSRPTHRVLFSQHAVIAPYADGRALMFRLVNGRRADLMDVNVDVVFTRFADTSVRRARQFQPLRLERASVTFFPLAWTVVHAITPDSPLWGATPEDLLAWEAEVLVVLRAVEEASHQNVHARTSYRAAEFRWGRRFVNLYRRSQRGHLAIDATRLHDTEPA